MGKIDAAGEEQRRTLPGFCRIPLLLLPVILDFLGQPLHGIPRAFFAGRFSSGAKRRGQNSAALGGVTEKIEDETVG
jgi:hypothetical protein